MRGAAFQPDGNTRLELAYRGIGLREDAIAQRDHFRIPDYGVSKLRFARRAMDDAGRAGMEDAELALESVFRRTVGSQLHHHRPDLEIDALDVARPDRVDAREFAAAVDRRMRDEPAGIGLVHVVEQLIAFAEPPGDHRGIELGGSHMSKAARCLDRALRAGEAARREQG